MNSYRCGIGCSPAVNIVHVYNSECIFLILVLNADVSFCYLLMQDMDHATKTRFNTLENKHKPLVCKELSKIWENDDCNLPWKKEDYDESNTLLLDDSPYKALLNPVSFCSCEGFHQISIFIDFPLLRTSTNNEFFVWLI